MAAGLLTEQDGQFVKTPEAQHFLVQDGPSRVLRCDGFGKADLGTRDVDDPATQTRNVVWYPCEEADL